MARFKNNDNVGAKLIPNKKPANNNPIPGPRNSRGNTSFNADNAIAIHDTNPVILLAV